MSRTEYATAMLSNVPPLQASLVLEDRLVTARNLNEQIAEWIKDRARIEEDYANELGRLSTRVISDLRTLGMFSPVWRQIVSSAESDSVSSSILAQKLRQEVEAPLRGYFERSKQDQMKALQDGLDNSARTLKDYEEDFTRQRRKNSNKVDSAEALLAEAKALWQNEASLAYGQFQGMDEARLVLLKESMARFQTLQLDKDQNAIQSREKILNVALSFEPKDEVSAFVAQLVANAGNYNSRQLPPRGSADSSNLGPPRFPTAPVDDAASIGSKDSSSKKGGAKLRSKVGSIFSRSGRNKKNRESAMIGGEKVSSVPEAPAAATSSVPSRDSVQSLRSSASMEPIPVQRAINSAGISSMPVESTIRSVNGTKSSANRLSMKPAPPPSRKVNGPVVEPADSKSKPMEPFETNGEDEENGSAPFRVDIRQDTITEEGEDADVALSNVATTLRSRPTISGRGSRGRRDIQSRLFTNIEPSDLETSNIDKQLPAYPAEQTEISQPQPPPAGGAQSAAVAESPVSPQFLSQLQTFANASNPPSLPSPSKLPPMAFQQDFAPPSSPHMNAETQSVRSIQSATSSVMQPTSNRHPDVPAADGLVATSVEILNATVKDGLVIKSNVYGEVAFAYNGTLPSTYSHFDLRLSNFNNVEKVVPNQALVNGGEGGVYMIGSIQSLVGLSNGIMGLKYFTKSNQCNVPLIFTPIWRIEQNQSSLMLICKLVGNEDISVIIQEMVISVPVEADNDSTMAVSAQSKPVASFNKDRQRIIWRFSEHNNPLTINKNEEQKLLCRFATTGPIRESSNGLDIKFRLLIKGTSSEDILLECKPVLNNDPFNASNEQLAISTNSEEWSPVPINKVVGSGKYAAHSDTNVQRMYA